MQLVLDGPVVCVEHQEPRIFAKLIMQGFVLRIAAFCAFMLNMKAGKIVSAVVDRRSLYALLRKKRRSSQLFEFSCGPRSDRAVVSSRHVASHATRIAIYTIVNQVQVPAARDRDDDSRPGPRAVRLGPGRRPEPDGLRMGAG